MSNTKKLRHCMVTFWVEYWGPENPCDYVENNNLQDIQYIVSGYEICPDTGKPHWQSYIELKKQCRISALQKMFNHKKWKILDRMGTQEQAIRYCKKDGQWKEFGTPKKQGKRNDLPSMQDLAEITSVRQLYEEHTANCIRLSSGMERAYNIARQGKLEDDLREEINKIPLYPWQQQCIQDVENTPRRKISWYWEPVGNVGKSHLVSWFAVNYNTLVLTDTSYKDCTYLYNDHEYVVFDLARSEFDPNWKTIEAFTNNYVTSRKYVPVNKICRAKVIVFSNRPPDEAALSRDRWNIHQITTQTEVCLRSGGNTMPHFETFETDENIAQN